MQRGKGRILIERTRVEILGYGSMVQQFLQAVKMLRTQGVSTIVPDARFYKPLDIDMIKRLTKEHEILIRVEEGSIGVHSITKQIGGQPYEVAAKVDKYARGMMSANGSTLFEELGLYYIGPVDGHNVEDLVNIFQKVKSMPAIGPVLIHIVTENGYALAEVAADKIHDEIENSNFVFMILH
ncbi:hypothetical protein K1719_009483 [Acacia pycnantha]|nr:hypothetical protein K1719_009483 [Acacia pycnantha]